MLPDFGMPLDVQDPEDPWSCNCALQAEQYDVVQDDPRANAGSRTPGVRGGLRGVARYVGQFLRACAEFSNNDHFWISDSVGDHHCILSTSGPPALGRREVCHSWCEARDAEAGRGPGCRSRPCTRCGEHAPPLFEVGMAHGVAVGNRATVSGEVVELETGMPCVVAQWPRRLPCADIAGGCVCEAVFKCVAEAVVSVRVALCSLELTFAW